MADANAGDYEDEERWTESAFPSVDDELLDDDEEPGDLRGSPPVELD